MLYSILSPIIITTSKIDVKFLKDYLQVYQNLGINMFKSSAYFSKLQLTASKTDEKTKNIMKYTRSRKENNSSHITTFTHAKMCMKDFMTRFLSYQLPIHNRSI